MKFAKFWSSKFKEKKKKLHMFGIDSDGVIPEDDGVTSKEKQKVFVYRGQSQGNVPSDVIHATVHPWTRNIKKFVFENHATLQSIVIPSNVKKIGWRSFQGCPSLVKVRLYEGVTEISAEAFRQCRSLIGSGHHGDGTATLTIPKTVKTIGWQSFAGCTSLVNVNIQGRLKWLEQSVFSDCTSLACVQLPRGLKFISLHAFSGCTSLAHIELPDGLEHIFGSAFENCISLCEISFPGSVARIGTHCFAGCCSLVNVEFQDEGLMTIYDEAFRGCTSLSAVALPSTLYELFFRAFEGCTSLLGVEFAPDCWVMYSETCFSGCKSLVNVSLPVNVVDETDAFPAGCDLLQGYAGCLKERYARFPVHQVCYNSSTATVDDLTRALDSSKKIEEDEFGMTAFHTLATSANPRVEILDCLLDNYSMEILCRQDDFGKTMMDYLLMHTSIKVVPLIQTVLQRSVLNSLTGWDTTRKWKVTLPDYLESIPQANGIDAAERRQSIVYHSFFRDLGHSMRLEMTSPLELALWKMRLNTFQTEDETCYDDESREICRLQSRAEVVIANIAEWLWDDETKCATALSFFPVCSVIAGR